MSSIINPRSNVVILSDNNSTADPDCIPKLREIRERGLRVDLHQGLDRRLTDDIAHMLSRVKHLRSIHYAWDLPQHEQQVVHGIGILARHIKVSRHMCFMLVGFHTTFEQDMYRFRWLRELGVRPYVMRYNELPDVRLNTLPGGAIHSPIPYAGLTSMSPGSGNQASRLNGQLSLLQRRKAEPPDSAGRSIKLYR